MAIQSQHKCSNSVTSNKKNISDAVEFSSHSRHNGFVNNSYSRLDVLRSALSAEIDTHKKSEFRESKDLIETLAKICDDVISETLRSEEEIECVIDPNSGLRLPPPPPTVLYKDRKSDPSLGNITPEEFIKRTMWGKYRDKGLLAAEFIRKSDMSLYSALHSRAQYAGSTLTQLVESCGILSRRMLLNPPANRVHQVALIRKAQLLSVAHQSTDRTK